HAPDRQLEGVLVARFDRGLDAAQRGARAGHPGEPREWVRLERLTPGEGPRIGARVEICQECTVPSRVEPALDDLRVTERPPDVVVTAHVVEPLAALRKGKPMAGRPPQDTHVP